jgi:hypothetical protein
VRRALFAAIALVVFFSPDVRAQEQRPTNPAQLPSRGANYAWDKNLLRASFSFRDVLCPGAPAPGPCKDNPLTQKLASGLPNVIAMRAYVFREGETNPVALTVRTCRVVFDLWDEVYRLKITGPGVDRDTPAINVEGVVRQCAEAHDLPVVDRPFLTAGQPHFLAVIVEVNPVSPQMLGQMRQWVSRPTGSTGIGPGDALFGSFVGLFVRQIGTSDKTVNFRTQSFTP